MPDRPSATPPSLHTLLAQIVDYAGLYPPADLPMEKAIHNYGRYRGEETAWMLSRFVCAVDHLDTLDAYALLFLQDPPFLFSVLSKGGATPEVFLNTLDRDLKTITAFHDHHPQQVLVEAIETALPMALHEEDAAAIGTFLDDIAARLDAAGLPDLELYFELPIDETTEAMLPAVTEALADRDAPEAGLKMRLGGSDADDHPEPALVAQFIAACAQAGVPFKATAGLHHPFRHYNRDLKTHMHGFVNVFGAAVLACTHDLGTGRIQSILADENRDHFVFDDGAFRWNDVEADVDGIRWARRQIARSFGSCSFEEPRDDLRVLGLV